MGCSICPKSPTNSALFVLACNTNQLTSLNVSAATTLNTLVCNSNNIASLDVSTNTSLVTLYTQYNQLTSLNTTGVTTLNFLNCFNNLLTTLDLSTNIGLTSIACQYNSLTSFNIQNGNNANLTGFDATNNPSLYCIQVDDATYMNTKFRCIRYNRQQSKYLSKHPSAQRQI